MAAPPEEEPAATDDAWDVAFELAVPEVAVPEVAGPEVAGPDADDTPITLDGCPADEDALSDEDALETEDVPADVSPWALEEEPAVAPEDELLPPPAPPPEQPTRNNTTHTPRLVIGHKDMHHP